MGSDVWIPVATLSYVTLQRLGELVIARRNTVRLLAKGGFEVGGSHYPLIVALHAAWLLSLWFFAPGRPTAFLPLVLFAVVQALRFWTLSTIGRRWTTRIIVVPGETLVARGPYRFVRHPNYTVVVLEIALLPLVFGLWWIAFVFSVLNAGVLAIRIPAEAHALDEYARDRQLPIERRRS